MYNINKGPSKLFTQTRRGIPSHLERLDPSQNSIKKMKENVDEDIDEIIHNVEKPILIHINEKTFNKSRNEDVSPNHREIIKYLSECWDTKICKQCKNKPGSNKCSINHSYVYFQIDEKNDLLKDFVPFDLENWWSKRLYTTITESV